MSWTYKSELDQIQVDLQKDTSTEGRWTFHRLMYFQPDQYQDWSTQKSTSGISYLTELLTNQNLPAKGSFYPGISSGFYVKDIDSIKSMTSNDKLDKFSYAVVDILYENKKENTAGGGGGYSSNTELKPWEKPVEDFTISYVEEAVPAQYLQTIQEENNQFSYTGDREYPTTTAGQPIYDLTMPSFKRKISWTIATRNKDYSLSAAMLNNKSFSFWTNTTNYNGGKITIERWNALILPPGLKRMFYEEKNGSLTPYDLWSYEMIIDEQNRHFLEWRNAGTQAIHEFTSGGVSVSKRENICSWYTIMPQQPSGYLYTQKYGFYDQMMDDRKNIDTYNLNITDEFKRAQFYGQFVTDNVPLVGKAISARLGQIDQFALRGEKECDKNIEFIFYQMDFKLGTSANDNIAFREKVERN